MPATSSGKDLKSRHGRQKTCFRRDYSPDADCIRKFSPDIAAHQLVYLLSSLGNLFIRFDPNPAKNGWAIFGRPSVRRGNSTSIQNRLCCDMRYLVKARVKQGSEKALLEAITDGTLGKGSIARDEYE